MFCSVLKEICVHIYRFLIVFTRPHYKAVSLLKTLLYPQCACSHELHACAFQYIGPRNWRGIEATWQPLSAILDTHGRVVWRPVVSILMTSPFSDSIVFSLHTRKQRFQKASFSNRFPLESVFEWLRFRLKTDYCGRGLRFFSTAFISLISNGIRALPIICGNQSITSFHILYRITACFNFGTIIKLLALRIDYFRYIKLSMAARLRGHKQRKLNEMFIHFLCVCVLQSSLSS